MSCWGFSGGFMKRGGDWEAGGGGRADQNKKGFRSDLARRGQERGNNTLFLSCCSPSLSLPSSLICTWPGHPVCTHNVLIKALGLIWQALVEATRDAGKLRLKVAWNIFRAKVMYLFLPWMKFTSLQGFYLFFIRLLRPDPRTVSAPDVLICILVSERAKISDQCKRAQFSSTKERRWTWANM